MSYTTVEEVKNTAGFTNNAYILSEDVQDHIDTADSIINSYLHGKYAVPFDSSSEATVPPLIEMISKKLASAYLLQTEYGPMTAGDSKDGFAKETSAMQTLEKIQKGTITLVDASGVSLLPASGLVTSFLPNDATSQQMATDLNGAPIIGVPVGDTNSSVGQHITLEKKW